VKGLECAGHSIKFNDKWEIYCACGATFNISQHLAIAHVLLASLPLTSAEFCATWKMKRSTARRWLLGHGAELRLLYGDRKRRDGRVTHEWVVTDGTLT
jgi:hypothetical protein